MSRTIIIVDDHILFAQSLQRLVNSFQEYEVIAIHKNGKEFVDYVESNKIKPDLLLLDVRMPVMDGLEVMSWLQEKYPDQKVLALTMEHDEKIIIKMFNRGCRGYLLKDIEPNEFLFALNEVSSNGYYFNVEATEALNNKENKINQDHLTKRELEFLSLACTEMTYKEIAEQMNLSPKTVDGYRESLFGKLEVKNRVGLVRYAVKNDILRL